MKKRVKIITDLLTTHFPNPAIPLAHQDPFTLLIATLLSAQCTDKRVNQITPLLFAQAKTPQEMQAVPLDVLEEIIRPCGLFKIKAKNIHGLSKILTTRYKGAVPKTLKSLESLPGVGHKTASVVICQAYNVPAFPVDTHIHRCAQRWGLTNGKSVIQTEKDLKKIFPKNQWSKLHLQIIYYARNFCPARKHNTKKCPICHALTQPM